MMHLNDFLFAEIAEEWDSFFNKINVVNRESNSIFNSTCSVSKRRFDISRMEFNLMYAGTLSDDEIKAVEWIESMYKFIFLDIDI